MHNPFQPYAYVLVIILNGTVYRESVYFSRNVHQKGSLKENAHRDFSRITMDG